MKRSRIFEIQKASIMKHTKKIQNEIKLVKLKNNIKKNTPLKIHQNFIMKIY